MDELTEISAKSCFYNAANVVSMLDEKVNSLFWPTLGQPGRDAPLVYLSFADFLLANPGVRGETLFRFAAGAQLHGAEAGSYAAQPFWVRAAYETFACTFPVVLAVHRDEAAREAAKAVKAFGAEILPADETILETHDPFEAKTTDAPEHLAIGGTDKPAKAKAARR